jgi:hypothetical protein
MFNASSWLLEPLFFIAKLLRKLTGIIELPGILINCTREFAIICTSERWKGAMCAERKRKLPHNHMQYRTSLRKVTNGLYQGAEMDPIRVTACDSYLPTLLPTLLHSLYYYSRYCIING